LEGLYPNRTVSGLSNIKILITLSYGEGCVWTQEFMTEDLGEEDIVGDIVGFELVATEGAVGASHVAWFPREVEGAEGGGNVLGELGPVVVLTAFGEGKLFNERRVSRAWTSFLGSARPGMR
jgi:hypothetical protein